MDAGAGYPGRPAEDAATQGGQQRLSVGIADRRVATLTEHLPARIKLTAEHFKPSAALPDTLQLDQLLLTAEGNLDSGYLIDGSANLPAEKGPVALSLKGHVDANGANIAGLDLAADDQQRLAITGKMNWQSGFTAQASIDWLDFLAAPVSTGVRASGGIACLQG